MVMTSQCPIVSIYLDIKGEHKVSMFVEFQSQMNLFIFFRIDRMEIDTAPWYMCYVIVLLQLP